MSAKSLVHITGGMLILASLSACENYRWTLNEQPIYNPPALYAGYDIADPQLKACVQQTVKDQKITQAEQLEQLNCSHNKIADLSGIEVFEQLRKINLSNNSLQHLSGLTALNNLEYVDLRENSKLDCTAVSELKTQSSAEVLSDC